MATTTTAASALRNAFTGEVIDNVWRNREFLERFPLRQASGAASERWSLVQTGQTGASFGEGGAFAAAGNNTYASPAIGKTRFQATYSITEDLEQDLAIGESRVFNATELEAEHAMKAVLDAWMIDALGTTGQGWELAVDATGTYAGLNRATTTGWDSSENALGGVLTIAALQNAEETLINVERVGTPNVLYMAPNQITNYLNLAGAGATTSLLRANVPAGGVAGPVNVGEDRARAVFGNMPIIPVRDMTTTVIIMTQTENWYTAFWDTPGRSTRGVLIQDVPPTGHQREVNIAMYAALVHTNPFKSHKETGVTA